MLQIWNWATLVERPHWPRLNRLSWWQRQRIDPVEMCARRFFYQPLRFRWRGMIHRVYRIERVWEQGARRGQAARRYFVVRCDDAQQYTLFQDLDLGLWHVMHTAA